MIRQSLHSNQILTLPYMPTCCVTFRVHGNPQAPSYLALTEKVDSTGELLIIQAKTMPHFLLHVSLAAARLTGQFRVKVSGLSWCKLCVHTGSSWNVSKDECRKKKGYLSCSRASLSDSLFLFSHIQIHSWWEYDSTASRWIPGIQHICCHQMFFCRCSSCRSSTES